MFNSICIRRQRNHDVENPVDLGFLGETMLFYENVYLVADEAIVMQLLSQCGPDVLMALVDEEFLKISYINNYTGSKTENTGTKNELYNPVTFTTSAWDLQNLVPAAFQKVMGKPGKGRRLGNRFAAKIHPVTFGTELIMEARQDYANGLYVRESVKELLRVLAPEYQMPHDFRFDIIPSGDFYKVETNLDFVPVNGVFHLRTPLGFRPISQGYILACLLDVRGDLHFSSLYGGEIATHIPNSTVIKVKCRELLTARMRYEKNIDMFQDLLLNDAHAIREAINSGERNFKDLLDLLHRARKFRHWLHDQEPDADLIKAYYKEVTKSTWVEALPVKTLRWVILAILSAVLGFVNPAVGIAVPTALSAADTFLLEKLVGGWRPDQFVEGSLTDFTQRNQLASVNTISYSHTAASVE